MRSTLHRFRLFAALVAGLIAAPVLLAKDPAQPRLEPASLGSTAIVHRFGSIWLASQPGKEDLALARDLGIRTVVNLRKATELDWDEEAAVRALGLAYASYAFHSPEELTDAIFDAVRRELAAGRQPLLLHCGTANRVGAIWLAHRVLDDGLTYEAALREAEEVGLKNPAHRDRARDYIERQKGLRRERRGAETFAPTAARGCEESSSPRRADAATR